MLTDKYIETINKQNGFYSNKITIEETIGLVDEIRFIADDDTLVVEVYVLSGGNDELSVHVINNKLLYVWELDVKVYNIFSKEFQIVLTQNSETDISDSDKVWFLTEVLKNVLSEK